MNETMYTRIKASEMGMKTSKILKPHTAKIMIMTIKLALNGTEAVTQLSHTPHGKR